MTALSVLFLSLFYLSCHKEIESKFPPHEVSFNSGVLKGQTVGIRNVVEFEEIEMEKYSHLRLKKGFYLCRAIYEFVGADARGFLVAVQKESNKGFAVEPLNSEHGSFLFAPIGSCEEALEYVKLLVHETPDSYYDRDHTYIHDKKSFENYFEMMKREVTSEKDRVEWIKKPPSIITRVIEQSHGNFLVELVYKASLQQQRFEYLACQVKEDGGLKLKERYMFVKGPPGPHL